MRMARHIETKQAKVPTNAKPEIENARIRVSAQETPKTSWCASCTIWNVLGNCCTQGPERSSTD